MSADDAATAAVASDRTRLAARALADLGRREESYARLDADRSAEGEALRLEIAWKAQDWPVAAATLERMVGEPPVAGETLNAAKARPIVHLATAHALAGNEAALARLRERFGDAMAASELADLFRVVASARDGRIGDVGAIARAAQDAAPFQNFLTNYREKLEAEGGKGS
jgi:hypothetical protein